MLCRCPLRTEGNHAAFWKRSVMLCYWWSNTVLTPRSILFTLLASVCHYASHVDVSGPQTLQFNFSLPEILLLWILWSLKWNSVQNAIGISWVVAPAIRLYHCVGHCSWYIMKLSGHCGSWAVTVLTIPTCKKHELRSLPTNWQDPDFSCWFEVRFTAVVWGILRGYSQFWWTQMPVLDVDSYSVTL